MKILVTGSSGFIGSHLVRRLKKEGHYVVGVDIEEPKYESPDFFYKWDLRSSERCAVIFGQNRDIDVVYNFACLMGGMGYIGDESKSHDIMTGSSLIVANVIDYSIIHKIKKHFYSSSACVYNMNKQVNTNMVALKESDAYPAMPDLVYGWQKLFSEQMYQAAAKSHGLDIRIARFHNIFGEEGIYSGGKEKAPAAICRKVSEAKDGTSIDIWGDGEQTRSFLHVSECVEGVMRLMNSDYYQPINIGSDEMISINKLTEMVITISGKKLAINHIEGPQGVRGRNSDNTLIREVLGWCPSQPLWKGMEKLYSWVNKQINH